MMAAKILVIEDERAVLQNTMEMLSLEGFDVLGAENGRQGVMSAGEYLPDLVICDIMMPDVSGYEVLAELRAAPQTALIPFIFLTARTDRRDVRRGMNLGADDYLTKPFTVSELIGSVHARLKMSDNVHRVTQQKLDHLRDTILLTVPHELRTPLTSVLGFSEMMMLDGPTLSHDQMMRMARHINTAARRLSRLVENYLIYAQTEIIRLDASRAESLVVGSSAIRDVVEEEAAEIASRANRLEDLVLDVCDGQAAMSEEFLRKIVSEVVDNAFKFSPAHTQVAVRGMISGRQYALSVIDQGRGMNVEDVARIGALVQFERAFYEQQGAGLGLVIAQRLAELHHGSLEVYSQPGQGTTVTVQFALN